MDNFTGSKKQDVLIQMFETILDISDIKTKVYAYPDSGLRDYVLKELDKAYDALLEARLWFRDLSI